MQRRRRHVHSGSDPAGGWLSRGVAGKAGAGAMATSVQRLGHTHRDAWVATIGAWVDSIVLRNGIGGTR